MCIFPHTETGYVCKDAVLTETGGQAGGKDDSHEEAEVDSWRDAAEHDSREGEESESHDIEDQGEDYTVRVVGAGLEVRKEEHRGEIGDAGDGDEG